MLLAEAGTGTGKTLAYLVPAILSRQRVLISTGTKNLQEQIYFKDLPALQTALGVPFTATYMKGRANYLCLHRLDQLRAHAGGAAGLRVDDRRVGRVTRDRRSRRAERPAGGLVALARRAATAETCLGSDCPQYRECYVTQMRQRAAESDVVIVNHHLLCADASVRQSTYGEVIPDCHNAIIDEAHQLEDVATQYFGISVSNYRVDDLVRDAERALNLGPIEDSDGDLRHAIGARRRSCADVLRRARRWRAHARSASRRAAAHRPGVVRRRHRRRPGADRRRSMGSKRDAEAAPARARPGAQVNEDAATLARRAGELRDHLTFLLEAATRRSSTSSRRGTAACSCARRRSTCRRSSARCSSTACGRRC